MKTNLIITVLSCAAMLCGGTAQAQKRGIFDAGAYRPERVTVAEGDAPVRLTLPSPVMPKGYRTASPIADASVRPSAVPVLDAPAAKAPQYVLGDGTRIYGSLIYSNAWAGTTGAYGIYSFTASQYSLPEQVYAQGSYEANGGGCYHDGKYYWNSFVYTDEMGYTFTTFCTYDFNTREFNKNILSFISADFDLQQITNGLTYDPTTDRIFALANIKVVDEDGYIAKYYPSFSELDPYTGFVTPIAQIEQMIAIASTSAGEIYTISRGSNASLYHINKNTGDCTLVGPTGISADYAQSMAFDPVTGKLYWAAVKANGSTGLYEVNVATGAASLIFNFGNNEEYTGLYIPAPEVNAAAPGAASDITADFVNGSTTGTVTVTAPDKTYAGAPLAGDVQLTVLTDNGAAETKTVAPGAKVTLSRTLAEGIHSFTAYATNTAGEGARVSRSVYVGIDAPAAVGNLTLRSTDDGKAHISWTAPDKGRNDGYVDPAQVSYTVTRYPDGKVIAKNIKTTYYTDPVDVPADNFYYAVTPYCGSREGITSYTETALFGSGSALPCRFDFSTREQFDLFTVIDANNDWDGQYFWGGWMYGPDFKYTTDDDGNCAIYGYHPETPADDWLITPPVGVEKGKKYRVTFTMWTRGQDETIEVTAGPANTIEAQSVILPKANYKHKEHKEFTADFTAAADGNYFVGFHITSKKKQYYAFVTDIMIDVVPDEDAPAAVADLKATAAPDGQEAATLTFTAPSTSLAGTTLARLDKIDIFRGMDNEPVGTITSPRPGQQLSWTDVDIAGMVEYRVVAYCNGKAGEKAITTVYVGWDIPVAVTRARVDDSTGHPVITWNAPTEGINGGFIDPSKLVYFVYRYEDDLELIARNVTATSYTDLELTAEPLQHLVSYIILASGPAGYSEPVATDYIVYGTPYAGEFMESFSDAAVHSTPWVMYRIKGTSQNWGVTSYGTAPYCSPVDRDGGMAVYATNGRVGDEGLLVSPKLDISGINSPVFSFYFYHNYTDEHEAWGEAFEDRLIPEVMLIDGTVEPLHDPIYVDDLGTGWLKYTCDLTKYKDEPYIRLSLHGITAMEQEIYVDRLEITNLIAHDLQAYSFTGSGKVEADTDARYKFTIFNRGADKVETGSYTVTLYDNGNVVETVSGRSVAPKDYYTYLFTHHYPLAAANTTHNLYAVIDWADDEIPSNNTSETISTVVTPTLLPEVSSLTADVSNDNNVTLAWNAPDSRNVNDSFEDHVAYEIDDFGGYTMVDRDGNYTWAFQDIYFDNTGAPQAFMVFNPVELGIVDMATTLFPYNSFDPHTGNQVLACFQGLTVTSDGYGVSATNDDWFISPEVFGGQTVSFYAKSGDYMQGVDKFRFMYSTTTNDVTAFTAMSDVVTTGKDWLRYEYTLPANAKYFAINCVSEDGFILFIDDLKFIEHREPSSVRHTGYRLYRDGIMLAEFPTTVTSFVDPSVAGGTYTYEVKATYEDGRESASGNKVVVKIADSVADVATAGITVEGGNGVIMITGTDAHMPVTVCAADGAALYTAAAPAHTIHLPAGVYLVQYDNQTYKVIVR